MVEGLVLRSVDGPEPGLALLTWDGSSARGVAVQVYVNGELYDVASDGVSGEMWLALDRSRTSRVEVVAVAVDGAWVDVSARLDGWQPGLREVLDVAVVRDERLDVDSEGVVSVNGADVGRGRLWSWRDGRHGFGGVFGAGGFGYDQATGPGLGLGEFGAGAFGADGAAWRWRGLRVRDGAHAVGVRVETSEGVVLGEAPGDAAVSFAGVPPAALELALDEDWVLSWR